jgi:hypothetical protein
MNEPMAEAKPESINVSFDLSRDQLDALSMALDVIQQNIKSAKGSTMEMEPSPDKMSEPPAPEMDPLAGLSEELDAKHKARSFRK